ncbi:MAG: AI-2E family transporter [Sandaracinus sp.]
MTSRTSDAGADAPKADASKADASKADASKIDASKIDASKIDASRALASKADDGDRSSGTKVVLTLAALVIVIAGLRVAGGFFLPVLVALFLTVVSTPLLLWLERVRVPRVLAVLATVSLDVLVLAGLVALVGSSLTGLHEAVPRYQDAVVTLVHSGVSFLQARGLTVEAEDLDALGDSGWMLQTFTDLVRELTEIVSNALLVVLLVIFMLFEIAPSRAKLAVLLDAPQGHFPELAASAGRVQRYLVVKTLLSAVTAVLFGGWLGVLGVDFALLWGLAAFLLNFIPTIGPAIATIPPVVIALLTLGPGAALAAAIGCLLVNIVIGNVFEPRMMGEALGLSTLVVFASMLFWGWLWGPVGALLAVPLTMLMRDALALGGSTRWLAALLGSPEWLEAQRALWGWAPPAGAPTPSAEGTSASIDTPRTDR